MNGTEDERHRIREKLVARRDFWTHVVVYLTFNLFFIAIWAMTGAGYFWPAWVLVGWGIGLVLHAYDVYFKRPVTEADIDAELRRHPPGIDARRQLR